MAGFALVLVLAPFSRNAESRLETTVHIRGSEAEAVDRELVERFQSPYAHRVVLVIQGLPDPDSEAGSQALTDITQGLRSEPQVAGVLSRLDWPDDLFLGKGGGTFVIIGLKPPGNEAANSDSNEWIEAVIPKLRAKASLLTATLRPQFPNLKMELTGEAPLNSDLRNVSSDDVKRAEIRALPITLFLLVLAFGSVVAATLPMGIGILAIATTLGAAALLALHLHLSILVQNVATMLSLGLGIDYALLMTSRYREALTEGLDAGTAADLAASQAGRTLLISASTVAIGFAVLLTVPVSELQSIGIAGLLVAATSVLLCTCIMPFVLGLLGSRVNAGNLLSLLHRGKQTSEKVRPAPDRWRRWSMAVTAHPRLALLLAGAPLLILTLQARHMRSGLPPDDGLPRAAESVQGLRALEKMQRNGIVESIRVVLQLPAGVTPQSDTGWGAISRLTTYLKNDPRAAQVLSLPTLTGMSESGTSVDFMDEEMRKSFLSVDSRETLLEVLPRSGVSPTQEMQWVRELRAENTQSITGISGVKLQIGGVPALDEDYDQVVKDHLPKVIGWVVVGSLIALLLGFRSLIAAIKAVALNLLSVGASFGALVLVFQDGYGSRIFGLANGLGSIYPTIPILSFAIVFGLSMDYEVFLVARVLEERRSGVPEREAVVCGLACTARLITSAAAIMIAVFAAFTMGNFVIIKMLGFTLAVAVFLDATIVRMVIGPALLQLAGDWNWWPLGLAGSSKIQEP
ncbi:MMPL family transporter [Acidicapsa dinghuensis]|uniref:MMPL family transporter n=1 Tax=Acidicapsa dinghuensis TaxID=2218256 RepID=A0ABW1EIZ4_9BACT|nr:MMPL family transporter [Acidicapsa dinghuensis]